ncbi:hypothetical protein LJC46_03295 [Desulfovibrio sp. OttesenSCG-928-G15]|nr:hypothetical protein [Desulfovibrio sp. OttesenSCG-928-G15]
MMACRLWEISENLHRAELSALERDKLVAEWCRLTGQQVRQVDAPSGGAQPKEQGIRETSRQLGLSEPDVRRAVKVASLTTGNASLTFNIIGELR